MTDSKPNMNAIAADLAKRGGSAVGVNEKADFSKAAAMTQAAINGLGGPVYASMTDSKPKDTALLKAQQDMMISKGGVKSVDTTKAPADRAINEALTLKAISSKKVSLKSTETRTSETMDAAKLAQLQADAKAEKDAKIAARTYGGGDIKEGMGSILNEINGQGGVIAVPSERAPKTDTFLAQTKMVMEINALKGEAIYASGTDHKVEDKALAQAKTLLAIQKKGESSVNTEKVKDLEKGTAEAKKIMQLNAHKKASLKSVIKPQEGLSKEQLAALQAAAKKEEKV